MPRPNYLMGIMTAGLLLSACSGGDEREARSGDPLAGRTAAQEDQFGEGFGKTFRADPDAEPAKVSNEDVNPVSLTAEPLDVD